MVFSHELLHWYEANGRILPWRETKDPYIIWLSEIILQQTKVVQGLPYFHQFIKTFPTMESLAEASEEEVLKLWQGLGYYSRARNLHKTAKYIQSEYHGIFPDTYSLISKLPGIGDYTACAILSFAFGKVYPVLDGNVGRVSTRFSGIFDPIENQTTKNKIKSILQLWIDKDKPALFNQAIMDFGALVCTPGKAICLSSSLYCPFSNWCYAYKHDMVENLPVKKQSKAVKNRYLHYYMLSNKEGLLLHKRLLNDIWKGLYDFPFCETLETNIPMEKGKLSSVAENIGSVSFLKQYTHLLSHQRLHVFFYQKELTEAQIQLWSKEYIFVPWKQIKNFAVPKVFEQFFQDFKII